MELDFINFNSPFHVFQQKVSPCATHGGIVMKIGNGIPLRSLHVPLIAVVIEVIGEIIKVCRIKV